MITLITGATAGIGEATAYIFAKNKSNLILTGRRKERLIKLKTELVQKYNVEIKILCFDIQSQDATEKAIASLSESWQHIDVLINNAGLALGKTTIDDGNVEDWEQMIDTNVKGLLYITKAIVPFMKARKKGHIVNLGSIAGKEVYRYGNVYCATKHAVEALTKGFRLDLLPYNIKVTGICPGPVETEFSIVRYKGDKEKAKEVYKDFSPLVAEDIAECIWFAVSRPAHVNINDMLIMPMQQANTSSFSKKS